MMHKNWFTPPQYVLDTEFYSSRYCTDFIFLKKSFPRCFHLWTQPVIDVDNQVPHKRTCFGCVPKSLRTGPQFFK